MDARVGGTYGISFTDCGTGNGRSFGGEYQELVPNERIRCTDSFDDPNLVLTNWTPLSRIRSALRWRSQEVVYESIVIGTERAEKSFRSSLSSVFRNACYGAPSKRVAGMEGDKR